MSELGVLTSEQGGTMETIGLGCCFEVEVLFTDVEFLRTESDIIGRLAPVALAITRAEGLLIQSTMQHTGLAFLNMEYPLLKVVRCRNAGGRA
jgi:hypothetical protein